MPATGGHCAAGAAEPERRAGAWRPRRGRFTGVALVAAMLLATRAWPAGAPTQPSAEAPCPPAGLSLQQPEVTAWLEEVGRSGGGAAHLSAAIEEAVQLLRECKVPAALAAFRQANELAGGRCGGCLFAMGRVLQLVDQIEPAIATTREAIAALGGEPLLGPAYLQLGDLLVVLRIRQEESGWPTAETDAAAEEAFGKAAAAAPAAPSNASYRAEALSKLAAVRVHQQRYPEAVETARRAIQADPRGDSAASARSTICRARRAGYSDEQPPAAAGALVTRGAVSGSERQEPMHVDGSVQRPSKIYAPAPRYTTAARQARLQGVIIIEAVIDDRGCVHQEKVLKGLPMGLNQSALSAVGGWVFEPATLDGKPVKVYYTLTVNFQVGPGIPPDSAAAAKP